MIWLILFISMTRGATVQVEIPFDTIDACETAGKGYKETGMSSVLIYSNHKCERR